MRIAIVNDMLMAVEAMRRIIVQARRDQIAWIARDGVEAVSKCAEDRPDLILMDLIMPNLDGVEATRRIMAQTPCAIVVVTANVSDNSSKVFEAMGAGALDAVNTPVLASVGNGEGAPPLLAKIETIRRLIGPGGVGKLFPPSRDLPKPHPHAHGNLLAIGASAGGPAALATILSHLPSDFPAAVVIVQHVDVQFVKGLAEWLDHQSRLPVRLAQEGETPRPGTVLLAGREDHLIFATPTNLGYTPHPMDCSYRPSIDVFFKSASQRWEGDIVGIVLTGMGRDGAEGLLALKQNGHHTITQDAASSAVYGMPKAAAELRAATEILALDKISSRLINKLALPSKTHG
jgi:two-component system response regulator WspF